MPQGRGARATGTRRLPSTEWQAFQATLLHPDQIAYEEIRPVVVLGQEVKVRAAELGVAPRTLARRVERFVQHSIPGLVASGPRKPGDKRLLPQPVREYILQLKVEHHPLTPREIASIVEVRFDRTVSHHTVERIIAHGPLPTLSRRRFPYYRQSGLRTRAVRPSCASMSTAGLRPPSSPTCARRAPPPTTSSSAGPKVRW